MSDSRFSFQETKSPLLLVLLLVFLFLSSCQTLNRAGVLNDRRFEYLSAQEETHQELLRNNTRFKNSYPVPKLSKGLAPSMSEEEALKSDAITRSTLVFLPDPRFLVSYRRFAKASLVVPGSDGLGMGVLQIKMPLEGTQKVLFDILLEQKEEPKLKSKTLLISKDREYRLLKHRNWTFVQLSSGGLAQAQKLSKLFLQKETDIKTPKLDLPRILPTIIPPKKASVSSSKSEEVPFPVQTGKEQDPTP